MAEIDDLSVLIRRIGRDAWALYCVMAVSADDQGVCSLTQQALGERIGASRQTVSRYLTKLAEAALINGTKTMDAVQYVVDVGALETVSRHVHQLYTSNSTYNVNNVLSTSKDLKELETLSLCTSPPLAGQKRKRTPRPPSTTSDVFTYWCDAYKARYDADYRVSNFGREIGQLKRLVAKYGGDVSRVKAIIDVVMRLYDARWKSTSHVRPTIGAFTSWIAAQAEAYVLASETSEKRPADDDDANFDLAAYNGKFGMVGD